MLAGHMSIFVTTTKTGTLRARARPRCSLVMPMIPALLPTFATQKKTEFIKLETAEYIHLWHTYSLSPLACRNPAGGQSCQIRWSSGTSRGPPSRWKWWPSMTSRRFWSSPGCRHGCPVCWPPAPPGRNPECHCRRYSSGRSPSHVCGGTASGERIHDRCRVHHGLGHPKVCFYQRLHYLRLPLCKNNWF